MLHPPDILNKLAVARAVTLSDETAPTDRLEVTVSVDRATSKVSGHPLADPTIFVEVLTYASFDAGVTWEEAGGFGFFGGIHVRRTGEEAAQSWGAGIYPRKGAGRLLKVLVTTNRGDVTVTPVVVSRLLTDRFVRVIDPHYRDLQPDRSSVAPVAIDRLGNKI